MNEEFEQDVIEEGVSGDEPLISHNHSNNNNYSNRNNTRNTNQRRSHGINSGQRRVNNGNGNLLSQIRNAPNRGIKNVIMNKAGRSKGFYNSYTNQMVRNNGNNSKKRYISSDDINNSNNNNLMNNSFDEYSDESSESSLKVRIPLALKVKIVLFSGAILLGIFIVLFIIAIFMSIFSTGVSTTQNINTDSTIDKSKFCSYVDVTFYKKNEDGEYVIDVEAGDNGFKTYDLETYVAGVVTGEVGLFKNEEVLKAFAVAARTYILTKGSRNSENGNCVVESSDRNQVMDPNPISRARKAAKDTVGEVLYANDTDLLRLQYDAFACYEKDDTYYYIEQGNIIPVAWVEENFPEINKLWTECEMKQAHGNGMSQYGAFYLAETQGYSYHEILNYYYGDQIKGFYCTYEEIEGSCPSGDENCEPEYEKICE